MEPLPETDDALDQFTGYGVDLRSVLFDMGRRAEEIVPSLSGLSLGLVQEGVTFTLVSSNELVALLDAAQYLDGGPCVAAAGRQQPVEVEVDDVLDEGRWSAYARASASAGVATTLSLPLSREGQVVGGINLYAANAGAFQGHHDELAQALGADAEGAVTDADLDFSTRHAAAAAPAATAELRDIDLALGMLSAHDGIDIPTAREKLEGVATRAGVSLGDAARVVRHYLHP